MTTTDTDPWLYLRIYVDGGFWEIEHLLVNVVPEIVGAGGFDRWFFLRYIDPAGLHLRLRLRTSDPGLESRTLAALAARAADPITPGSHRPTIMPPPALGAPYMTGAAPGGRSVIRDVYEPEVERFGSRGIDCAERLFQTSSEVTLGILAAERRDAASRKSVAPALMWETWRAFCPGDATSFWSDYAAYWLARSPGLLERSLPRFLAKAEVLAAKGVSVLAARTSKVVQRWATAAQRAATELGGYYEVTAKHLAYRFIHLTNNRLGLMPIEEAYFATLLGHTAALEVAA